MDFLRVKKLPGVEGGLAYSIKPRNIITDPGKMSVTVTITTEQVDRSRDVVVTKGLDLSDHERNPVALLDHKQTMPVGLAQDPEGRYTCKHVGDYRIDATTYFHQHTELGEQAFRLVESGVLRGASVGFMPIPSKVEKGRDSHGPVTIYGAGKLIEYSHLVLPDNPDCLVLAVRKGFGGKKLLPELLQQLSPLIPHRSATVVSGWEGNRNIKVKQMNEQDDDTLMGGEGDDNLYSGQPVGAGPVEDDPMSDDMGPMGDDAGDELPMNAGAQFAHGIHDKVIDLIGFIDEALSAQEHAGMRKAGAKLQAASAKMLAAVQEAYEAYKDEFPDQPDLPDVGLDEPVDDDMGDEFDEGEAGAESDDMDIVEKEGDDLEAFDGGEDDKEEKAIRAWVIKARNAWRWWKEYHKHEIANAQMEKVQKAIKAVNAMHTILATGKFDKPKLLRVCKGMETSLREIQPSPRGAMVTKAVKENKVLTKHEDQDAAVMEALQKSGLLKRFDALEKCYLGLFNH